MGQTLWKHFDSSFRKCKDTLMRSNQCFPRYFTTYKQKHQFIQRLLQCTSAITCSSKAWKCSSFSLDKQTVDTIFDEILPSNKKGSTVDTLNSTSEHSKHLSGWRKPVVTLSGEEPQSQNSVIVTGSRSVVTWRTRRSGGGTVRAHWRKGEAASGVTGMLVTLVVTVCVCQNSVVQFNYVQSINYQFHLKLSCF